MKDDRQGKCSSAVDSNAAGFITGMARLTNQLYIETAEFEILEAMSICSCNTPGNCLFGRVDVETEDVLNEVGNRADPPQPTNSGAPENWSLSARIHSLIVFSTLNAAMTELKYFSAKSWASPISPETFSPS